MRLSKLNQIYFKSIVLLVPILALTLYIMLSMTQQLLKDMMYKQAEAHISILARGSIDDVLAKDYGNLEQWVRQAASPSEYAYVYILSNEGKILLHSDLGYAGVTRQAVNTLVPLKKHILFENRDIIEIIYPIIIEDTFLGSAHLAYYLDNLQREINTLTHQLIIIYLIFSVVLLGLLYVVIHRSIDTRDERKRG